MSGLILIDRAMLSHHIVGIKNPLRFSAWCWMLSKARYKPGIYFDHGHEISLEIGQFVCGRKHMAQETGMTEKQVRTFLMALDRADMATKAVHPKGQGINIITVCNYSKYQRFNKYKGPSKGPAKGQGGAKVGPHSVTTEETTEETTVVGGVKTPSQKRGSRLSKDWFLPKEYGEWALGEGYDRNVIEFEAAKFKDWWVSKSGKDATKMDWLATWRNWMRNSKQLNGGHNGNRNNNGIPQGGKRIDPALEQIARLAGIGPA